MLNYKSIRLNVMQLYNIQISLIFVAIFLNLRVITIKYGKREFFSI